MHRENRKEGKNILIVEDDEMTLSIIERSFHTSSQTFHTTLSKSLKEAVSLISQVKFDAIISDYHLGDGNASYLMSKAKDTPFIVVTSDDDTALATHLIRIGADEFVSKDSELRFVNTLPVIVESAIERRNQLINYKKEEKRFRELFENSSVMIQSVDDEGKLIYANTAWLKMLDYTEEELNRLHYLDVIHPFDHKYAKNLYTKIGPGVHLNNIRIRFVDKRGDIIHTNGTINCTDDKKPYQIHGMFNNITEEFLAQKKLSRSEKKYRELVETADDTICRIDFKGYFRFVNEHGEKLSGFDKKDLIGTHFLDLIDPEHKEAVGEFFKQQHINKTSSTYLEFPIITKQGNTIWVGQKTTEYKKGKFVRGYQLVIRDITDKKLAEKKIVEQKEELESQKSVLQEQNEMIRGQNEMIKENYEQLKKAKIGKKAVVIVLLVAVVLFVLSEIWLEPIIERKYPDSDYIVWGLKGCIALILKPLESFIETLLTRRSYQAFQKSNF